MMDNTVAEAIAHQFIDAVHASSSAAERGEDIAAYEAGGEQMALLKLTVTLGLEHQVIVEVTARDPFLGKVLPEQLDTYR